MAKTDVLVLGGGTVHDWDAAMKHIVDALGGEDGLDIVTASEDLSALEAGKLAKVDVLVFYYTEGEITDGQRNGFSRWLASGKGCVALHAATCSFVDDPDYLNLIGATFLMHAPYRTYQVSVAPEDHAITRGVDTEFLVDDEQYIHEYDERVHVHASALWKGDAHPVVWSKSHGDGRLVYIALGHDEAAWTNPNFKSLLVNSTLWARRLSE